MKTSLDCLICFMRQARSTGMLATDDEHLQRRLIDSAGQFLATANPELSPPENAIGLYTMMADILKSEDPFAQVKHQSNASALLLKKEVEQQIVNADDPLRAAIRVAIGGNIIDYAAQHVFDLEKTMKACFTREFVLDDYPSLLQTIQRAQEGVEVLYLCDNCGEIVFDALLIDQLKRRGCRVTAAVRETPIINDATMEDALAAGLDKICPVITNGTGCPGTPLAECSAQFQQHFSNADCIISKGMGNYETLSDEQANIYFLFTVKCPEVARHVTAQRKLAKDRLQGTGEMILMQQSL
ncbi:MAG: hypothetical protein DSY58_06445 [Desulfobulbus sp.]|nr:MAG: hypothetical protein DSY58_06445 [Desulfobulbus sp.]